MDEIVMEQIISNPNSGSPIPPPIKYELETRFKVNLSDIKIYSGPDSKSFLYRMGANALVSNNNVFVQENISDAELKQTLIEQLSNNESFQATAHEAAHVVQQRTGGGF